MQVVILLADGARPDTMAAMIASGEVPALAQLAEEGAFHTVTSCFPTVTGPAYAPFLMGRFPAPIGIPALRWYDRSRTVGGFPDFARSYVGYEMGKIDTDLDPDAPTMFELTSSSLASMNMISRGLPRSGREGGISPSTALKAARIHFTGNVAGWLDVDRFLADRMPNRIRDEKPEFVFASFGGIDKTSHATGHESEMVREAYRIVDRAAARVRADAERDGRWDSMQLWIGSDHGHSRVLAHEDLAGVVKSLGHRVMAHPWTFTSYGSTVGVMVSGNAMAHLYVDLRSRARPVWPEVAARWGPLADALMERPSVDLMILPTATGAIVRGRGEGRGDALITLDGGRISYVRERGDPLALGRDWTGLDRRTAYELCADTDYPDGLVQIAFVATSPRSGEIILSAARDWDYRSKFEPIPHVSSHGALHREHMLVPLIFNRRTSRAPLRTVDTMPTALAALGRPIPPGLDGENCW